MPKIITFTALAIVIVIVSIFVAGKFSDPQWSGSASSLYDEKKGNMFSVVTEPEQIRTRKRDVSYIEITDFNNGLTEWTEHLKDGGKREFVTVRKDTPNSVTFRLLGDDDEFTARWNYRLTEDGDGTRITIEESSRNPNLWKRGVDVLRGRDFRIQKEINSLHRGLIQYLLNEE
jgi:hypothetical protein